MQGIPDSSSEERVVWGGNALCEELPPVPHLTPFLMPVWEGAGG